MNNNNDKKFITVASLAAQRLELYSIENNGNHIFVSESYLVRLLSQVFQKPYKILLPSDGKISAMLPDGNWTGIMGMVHRSEVDLAAAYVRLTHSKFEVFNFSYPHEFSDISFITNKPKPSSTSLAILNPFPLLMWLLIIASLFTFSSIFFLYMYRKQTYKNILLMFFGSLLEKSIDLQLRKFSRKLVLSTWLIFTFFIIYCYKAVLLSILTLPTLVGIRDIRDLAKAADQRSITCYAYKGTQFQQNLLKSEFDTWISIGKCMERNAITSENVVEEFLKASSAKAFITARNKLKPYKEKYFLSKDSFFNAMSAIPVSKNFCCLSYLNKKIHHLFAAGIFLKIDNDKQFFVQLYETLVPTIESETSKILELEDLQGAFIVLFSGYVLSIIVLLSEISVQYYFTKSSVTLVKCRRKSLWKI